MKRNISVCRLRKESGLPCHNCMYYDDCPEYRKEKPMKKKRNCNRTANVYWTKEEIELAEDFTLSIQEVADMIGRSEMAVRCYRAKIKKERGIK